MHRGDRFKASVVAFGFMALLLLSPAGAVLDRLSSGLGEHAGSAWIGLAMIVFWATYFTLRAVRLRREHSELLPPERAPD
jgi:hypothetical protein